MATDWASGVAPAARVNRQFPNHDSEVSPPTRPRGRTSDAVLQEAGSSLRRACPASGLLYRVCRQSRSGAGSDARHLRARSVPEHACFARERLAGFRLPILVRRDRRRRLNLVSFRTRSAPRRSPQTPRRRVGPAARRQSGPGSNGNDGPRADRDALLSKAVYQRYNARERVSQHGLANAFATPGAVDRHGRMGLAQVTITPSKNGRTSTRAP